MDLDVQLLRDALRTEPSEDDPGVDFAIERLGDRAFDWILGALRGGALAPSEQVRGLRLLALLSRQFCVARKGELLDLTLALSRDQTASVEVRSAAAHIAVLGVLAERVTGRRTLQAHRCDWRAARADGMCGPGRSGSSVKMTTLSSDASAMAWITRHGRGSPRRAKRPA